MLVFVDIFAFFYFLFDARQNRKIRNAANLFSFKLTWSVCILTYNIIKDNK